jgi:hypothetical protein
MDTNTTTEKTEKKGLPIELLVQLGDAIHNSDIAVVFCNNQKGKTGNTVHNEASVCMLGTKDQMINLVAAVISKDKDIEEILTRAIIRKKMADFTEFMDKKKGE